MSWTTTSKGNGNVTDSVNTVDNNDSKLPLAIALPVCLIGIPLLTVLVIVVITCYRSKFKYKGNTVHVRKLKDENVGENQNEVIRNHAETATYANLTETVRETKKKTALDNGEGRSIAKGVWPKAAWKKDRAIKAVDTATECNSEDSSCKASELKDAKAEEEVRMIDERMSDEAVDQGISNTTLILTGRTGKEDGNLSTTKQLNGNIMRLANKPTAELSGKTPIEKPNHEENRKTYVVMYPVDSVDSNRLTLSVNDVIFFMEEEQDGWMKGEKKESGEVGWFPKTHVREGMSPLIKKHSTAKMENTEPKKKITMTTTAAMMTTTKTEQDDSDAYEDFDDDDDDYETGIEYRALYPYLPLEEGDLSFDADDIIVVVEKQENGWWRGYRGDDQGLFPGSYVQIINEDGINGLMGETHFADSELPSPIGVDVSCSVPELRSAVPVGEDVDDEDHHKKKAQKTRKSIGLFLMSLPRKVTSSRTGGSSGLVSPTPNKTKKMDRVAPGLKKKKKNTNPLLMTRRVSIAPGPPPSGEDEASTLTQSVLAGLAQVVAETANFMHERDVIYEEIGTDLLAQLNTSSESDFSTRNKAKNGDKGRRDISSVAAAHSFQNISQKENITSDVYANIGGSSTEGNEQTRKRGGQRQNMNDDHESETTETVTAVTSVPFSNKPTPPQKPNYAVSTPNIAALIGSNECIAVEVKRSPRKGEKPKPLAKPNRVSYNEGQSRDFEEFPRITKPKPVKEKPKYLSPGFHQTPAGQAKPSMRREICRSLDSILVAADAEEEESSDKDEGEFGIMKWLHKKLSVEDEMNTKRRGREEETEGLSNRWNKTEDDGRVPQKPLVNKNDNSLEIAEDDVMKLKDGPRIVYMFDGLSKTGMNGESFA